MLSAAAYPVRLYPGLYLPPILPQSDRLHAILWDAHFYLAFVFFAIILLHIAAAFFHLLVRKDGVFETMGSISSSKYSFKANSRARQAPQALGFCANPTNCDTTTRRLRYAAGGFTRKLSPCDGARALCAHRGSLRS